MDAIPLDACEIGYTWLTCIGAQFEEILLSHRMAVDFMPLDSARFSILAAECRS